MITETKPATMQVAILAVGFRGTFTIPDERLNELIDWLQKNQPTTTTERKAE